jgi:hypothetical protein
MTSLLGASAAFNDLYRSDVMPLTGGYLVVQSTLRSKISSLTSGAKFWISITSDGLDGVRGRWNQEYKQRGMHHIAIVYTTSCDNFAEMLKQTSLSISSNSAPLSKKKMQVVVVPPPGSPPYSVYVAWE